MHFVELSGRMSEDRLRALLSSLEIVLLDADEVDESSKEPQGARGRDNAPADLTPKQILKQLLLVS